MSILPWWVNGVAVFMIYSIQVLLIDIQCGNDMLIRVIRYVFGRHESNGEMSPVALLVNFWLGVHQCLNLIRSRILVVCCGAFGCC